MRIFVDHFLEIISKHPSFQFFKVKIVHYVLSIDEVFHDLFFKNITGREYTNAETFFTDNKQAFI